MAVRAAERRRAGAVGATELRELRRIAEVPPGPALTALEIDRTFTLFVARLAGVRSAQDTLHRAWDQLLLAGQRSERWAARSAHEPDDREALAATIDAGDAVAAARVSASGLSVVLSRWT